MVMHIHEVRLPYPEEHVAKIDHVVISEELRLVGAVYIKLLVPELTMRQV